MEKVDLLNWLKDMLMEAKNSATETRSAGVNSAGHNYDLGQIDAFQQVIDRLEGGEDD